MYFLFLSGLSVEIFLDQTYYMWNKLSKRAGARVVIHDPFTAPLPDEYGLDLQPNTASSMSIQTTNITRLEKPYTPECTPSWNTTGYKGIPPKTKFSLAVSLNHFRYCCHCIRILKRSLYISMDLSLF